MGDRKIGPREAQLIALREARYMRGQAKNREQRTPPVDKPKKPPIKKKKRK